MGSDSGRDNEKPEHRVYLDAFYIDKYEVTVQQYRACVQAGGCAKPYDGVGNNCNWSKSDKGRHPINCVDWKQSKAYCTWVGKRIPSEAEWEKVARGTDGRRYPWGNHSPSCDYAIFYIESMGCGKNSTWPVGSKPNGASPYGAMDMAGNMEEWVADWYDMNYYKNAPNRNPNGPGSGTHHVYRGGSWFTLASELRSSFRTASVPSNWSDHLGFRCARTP